MSKQFKIRNQKAFTLVELLVVIAIIGLLASISVIALNNARAKSRDTKRVGDLRQVSTALEMFFNDAGRYPTNNEWASGSLSYGGNVYLANIPAAPGVPDGTCDVNTNQYVYAQVNSGDSYTLSFCLGGNTGALSSGDKCLTPGGILNAACGVSQTLTLAHAGNVSSASALGIFVSGNYAYVSGGNSVMTIFDITDKANPTQTGSINLGGGTLFSIFVSGNYAYVVDYDNNILRVIDVTNKTSPVETGTLSHGQGGAMLLSPYSLYVSGNYVYVASFGNNAFEVVDVTDKYNPTHLTYISNGNGGAQLSGPMALTVSGDYAYVASYYSNALEILNISDPTNPYHVGVINHGSGGAILGNPLSVAVSGNYAYVGTNNAVEIVDITDKANPAHSGVIQDGSGGAKISCGANSCLAPSGNYLFLASLNYSAMEVIDITDKTAPAHADIIYDGDGGATLNAAYNIFVSGSYAYITASGSNYLEIVSLY